MSIAKDRAWLWHKQGLDGSLEGTSTSEVLARTGWSRSVGGVNPYLALFARCGAEYPAVLADAERMKVYELPSARGCTYVVPSEHFGLSLGCAQGTIDTAPMKTATKFLGVSEAEIDALQTGILDVLKDGAKTPNQLKKELGDLVRGLGDEGKKRGQSTTLSLGLAPLQTHGRIVREPIGGGFVTQNYAYRLWPSTPSIPDKEEAEARLAQTYFKWCGPATLEAFRWFSGLGVGRAKSAIEAAGLGALQDGRFISEDEAEDYAAFEPKSSGRVAFLGSLDNMHHLTQNTGLLFDTADAETVVPAEKNPLQLGNLTQFTSHVILADGRLIGMWEFDAEASEVVYCTWADFGVATTAAAEKLQAMVQAYLGDCRSFALDTPASRTDRLELIRHMGKA